uniref:PDZ domain-containing protein n=1 Tax=Ditylenchus dipsaci TaxID=166011 RepID=A0A915EHV8_9BILA
MSMKFDEFSVDEFDEFSVDEFDAALRTNSADHLLSSTRFHCSRSDRLQVGEICSVNGFELAELTHHQIMVLLRNAGPCVELAVEYDLNASCFRRPPAATTLQRCVEIGLEDEFDEGCDAIRPGGPAHREGRLRVGDRILAIIIKAGRVVQLTVEYDVPVLSTLQKANGPILLEIEKVPGIDFGLVLSMRRNKSNVQVIVHNKATFISSRNPYSVHASRSASIVFLDIPVYCRCGAIHVGDQLLAIDGITLEFTNLGEVYQLLRSQCLLLRLEILPQVQRINCEELDSRQVKINRAAEQLLYSKHSTIVALPNGATSPDGVRRRRSRESIRQPSPTHQRLNSNTSSSCSPPEVQTRQPARTQAARKAVHRNHTSTMGNNSSDTVVKVPVAQSFPEIPEDQI